LKQLPSFRLAVVGRLNKIFLVGILILLAHSLSAQQPQVYNQFFMNPYMYNPAYAGVEGHTVLFVMHRNQWTNIEDAPKVSHVSFHVPLKGGIALGAAAFNVSQGILTTSAAKISAGYLVNIDRTHFLRFGMSIGGGMNSLNITEFDSPDDPAFNDFQEQSSFLMGDFGMTYHFGHFNIGISLPNLFSYNPVTQKEVSEIGFSPTDNILFKMNYRGHVNDDLALEPHIIYRYSGVSPSQYEGTLIAHIKHIVWVGASYRQDAGIVGLFGAKVKEKIGIGFAYEIGNPNISTELGPTLEVNIGYHLGTKKDHAEHVSSFIKSHRLSAEERAKEAELERQKQLAALQKSRTTETADEDALSIATPTPISTLEEPKKEESAKEADWDHQEDHGEITRTNEFGEEETGIRLEKPDGTGVVLSWVPTNEGLEVADDGHLERDLEDGSKEVGIKYEKTSDDGSVEQIVKWDKVITEKQAETITSNPELTEAEHKEVEKGDPELTDDFRTHEDLAKANDHATVKRGDHLLELPVGNFVIAGAFSSFQHAENFSDDLFQQGFHDTIVGYSSARGYYYVVLYQSGSVEQARRRKNELRKQPKFNEVWVLQVTE
jgi:type IX secretion system PorP/SprF family membrane protein